jgi:hypothetical protein
VRRVEVKNRQKRRVSEEMVFLPLEASCANDLLLREGAKDAGDDFISGILVVLLESVILCDFFPDDIFSFGSPLAVGLCNLLAHVQFGGNLLFLTELHDEVVIASLSLSDGRGEGKLGS